MPHQLAGQVTSVSRGAEHSFSKPVVDAIELLAGLGVKGDAHAGETVKHRSRVAVDPNQPNLRQVHLLPAALFAEMHDAGHPFVPGDLGENIVTDGVALRTLPAGTRLAFSSGALVELTGLRNPCKQIEAFQAGMLKAMVGRDEDGNPILKAGVMGIVVEGGTVTPGDRFTVHLPPEPHTPMKRV